MRSCATPSYCRRRFSVEVIELSVRWYLTYRLSYRDLAAEFLRWGPPDFLSCGHRMDHRGRALPSSWISRMRSSVATTRASAPDVPVRQRLSAPS